MIISVMINGAIVIELQAIKKLSDTRDECASYLISILMDSTIGVIIVVLSLRVTLRYIRRYRLEHLEQGNYLSKSGKIILYNYGAQTVVWIVANLIVI